jgi:hypothetical protein
MTAADTQSLTRAQAERVLWHEYQQAIADADVILLEHRAAVDHVHVCGRRWLAAFRDLEGV